MKTKHTQGEWICNPINPHNYQLNKFTSNPPQQQITEGEAQANAKLIASAPELLEALRILLENQGYDGRYEDGVGYYSDDQVKAQLIAKLAIKKATE